MKKKIKCKKNKNLCKINHGKNAKLHMNPLIEQALLRLLKDTSDEKQVQPLEEQQEGTQYSKQRYARGHGHSHTHRFMWYFNVPSVFEVAVSKLADKLDMYDPMMYSLY